MASQILEAPNELEAMLRRALLVQRAADTSERISARLAAVASELRRSACHTEDSGALMLRLAGEFDRFAAEGGAP